ncbi:C-type mannose receptor 2-like [Clupea harengus]|uniref:C-type mannose receptor 2-like n=1 Tax=Clupea harengus TaxID=7950 RepID=A0A6P8GN26_CLUHA|nr:C-type mannose receptor 2-like [Clupea harengus]
MHEAGATDAWIGLKQGSSPKWQWSLADRDLYREDGAEFREWDSDPPEGTNKKDCTVMKGNGKWRRKKCDKKMPFICYDEKNSTHPYVLVTDEKNWADAQRYCREKHTDLASVRNQIENDQIKENINIKIKTWIGLFRDAWEWSDGSTSSFRHWETGEPNYNDSPDGFCAQIASSGQWNDADCHNPSNFICYEDKLVLVRQNKTWIEAMKYCRQHHVDLVSVTSERIQRWVRERAKGASSTHMWMGLRYSCMGFWFWVNGDAVCFNNWAQGEGTGQDCQSARVGAVKSGIDGKGEWVVLPETQELNFICTTEDQ